MRPLAAALVASAAALLFACDHKDGPAAQIAGTVPITVGKDGFQPSSVTFPKGAPATLVFTRTTDETCAKEVVFPDLNIKKELPLNTAVSIPVPTDKVQTIGFQCGMGMYKSSVVIAAK